MHVRFLVTNERLLRDRIDHGKDGINHPDLERVGLGGAVDAGAAHPDSEEAALVSSAADVSGIQSAVLRRAGNARQDSICVRQGDGVGQGTAASSIAAKNSEAEA